MTEQLLDLSSRADVRLDESRTDRTVQILLEVAETIAAADGVRPAMERLAGLALQAVGADRCAILLRDESHQGIALVPSAAASVVGDPLEQWSRFRRMTPIEVTADARLMTLWNTPRVVTLDEAQDSPLIPDEWKTWGSRSLAFAPVRVDAEIIGVLAVDHVRRKHRFTADEARLLETIASAAGVSLRSARLVEQLKRSVDIERRLSECLRAVRADGSLDDALDLVADRFSSLLQGASCSINLLNHDATGFRVAAWRGVSPPRLEMRLDEFPGDHVDHVRHTWRSEPQRPILVPDIGVLAGWDQVVSQGIRTGMLVPLWDGANVLGFVAVGRSRRPFSDDEVRVAAHFADHAALAVTQARMRRALEGRLQAIESLQHLSEQVARTSNLRSVLDRLNRGICREVGIRCLRVTFRDPNLAQMLRAPSPNADERRIIRRWASQRDPVPITNGAEMQVPMPMGGKVRGILRIKTRRQLDALGLELLRAIAAAIGEVAWKARLRRRAEEHGKELAVAAERERIARDLHDTLGQTFYGIGLKLQDLLTDETDPDRREALGAARALAAEGVSDVRSAVYALSFLQVRARGLGPSLRSLIDQFERGTGIEAELRLDGSLSRLPDGTVSAVYRVVHEALVNVERHARATGVVVRIRTHDDALHLAILDDGVGLDQRQAPDWRSAAHFGMRMMARAIEAEGGSFETVEAQPRGLIIRASIPLRRRRIRR